MHVRVQVKQHVPSVEELIAARNYVGATTVLNFKCQGNRSDVKLAEWLAYAYFHNGEHDKVQSKHTAVFDDVDKQMQLLVSQALWHNILARDPVAAYNQYIQLHPKSAPSQHSCSSKNSKRSCCPVQYQRSQQLYTQNDKITAVGSSAMLAPAGSSTESLALTVLLPC